MDWKTSRLTSEKKRKLPCSGEINRTISSPGRQTRVIPKNKLAEFPFAVRLEKKEQLDRDVSLGNCSFILVA